MAVLKVILKLLITAGLLGGCLVTGVLTAICGVQGHHFTFKECCDTVSTYALCVFPIAMMWMPAQKKPPTPAPRTVSYPLVKGEPTGG